MPKRIKTSHHCTHGWTARAPLGTGSQLSIQACSEHLRPAHFHRKTRGRSRKGWEYVPEVTSNLRDEAGQTVGAQGKRSFLGYELPKPRRERESSLIILLSPVHAAFPAQPGARHGKSITRPREGPAPAPPTPARRRRRSGDPLRSRTGPTGRAGLRRPGTRQGRGRPGAGAARRMPGTHRRAGGLRAVLLLLLHGRGANGGPLEAGRAAGPPRGRAEQTASSRRAVGAGRGGSCAPALAEMEVVRVEGCRSCGCSGPGTDTGSTSGVPGSWDKLRCQR